MHAAARRHILSIHESPRVLTTPRSFSLSKEEGRGRTAVSPSVLELNAFKVEHAHVDVGSAERWEARHDLVGHAVLVLRHEPRGKVLGEHDDVAAPVRVPARTMQ